MSQLWQRLCSYGFFAFRTLLNSLACTRAGSFPGFRPVSRFMGAVGQPVRNTMFFRIGIRVRILTAVQGDTSAVLERGLADRGYAVRYLYRRKLPVARKRVLPDGFHAVL